jgi:hypothetical protein
MFVSLISLRWVCFDNSHAAVFNESATGDDIRSYKCDAFLCPFKESQSEAVCNLSSHGVSFMISS